MGSSFKGATKNTDANALIQQGLEESKETIEYFGAHLEAEVSLRLSNRCSLKQFFHDAWRRCGVPIQTRTQGLSKILPVSAQEPFSVARSESISTFFVPKTAAFVERLFYHNTSPAKRG